MVGPDRLPAVDAGELRDRCDIHELDECICPTVGPTTFWSVQCAIHGEMARYFEEQAAARSTNDETRPDSP